MLCRIQRALMVLIFAYALLYLFLMNGVYVTNHTHRTSINIRFNKFKDNIRDIGDVNIERTRHQIEPSDAKASTEQPEKVILATGEELEYPAYMDNDADAVRDAEFDYNSEMNEAANIVKKDLYQKPILRKIEGRNVFYISAVADDSSFRNLPTAFDTSGETFLSHHNNESQGDVDQGTNAMRYIARTSWVKSRVFLQPLSLQTSDSWFGTVTLNGWEGSINAKVRYFCCYRYDNESQNVTGNTETSRMKGKIKGKKANQNIPVKTFNSTPSKSSRMMWKNIWNEHNLKVLKAAQFVCPLITEVNGIEQFPTKVALSDKQNCTTKAALRYIDIEKQFPKKNSSIALCPKLIYGNYSAERLIEWFEFNKLMGVDKIMLFTHNVVQEVRKVLVYYEQEGLLVTRPFAIPSRTKFQRKPGGKNTMAFQDEQVTVFHCIERFNNFRFVAIIDLDEFLVPAEAETLNGTWLTMLSKLQERHPGASGFVFQTEIFTLDWGISNPAGNLFVTKYILRTKTMWDRRKNIVIPENTQRGMVWTHAYTGVKGYKKVEVPPHIAKIFHYRTCRREWIKHDSCMSSRARLTDKTMLLVMKKIEYNILNLKNKLLRRYPGL